MNMTNEQKRRAAAEKIVSELGFAETTGEDRELLDTILAELWPDEPAQVPDLTTGINKCHTSANTKK